MHVDTLRTISQLAGACYGHKLHGFPKIDVLEACLSGASLKTGVPDVPRPI